MEDRVVLEQFNRLHDRMDNMASGAQVEKLTDRFNILDRKVDLIEAKMPKQPCKDMVETLKSLNAEKEQSAKTKSYIITKLLGMIFTFATSGVIALWALIKIGLLSVAKDGKLP